ncbi:MAG: homoserine O-succinyltransferase [Neomegalonema sp.]|nr:homoserine O-succinyltransferase [Neomegalonema sp.]
MPIKIPAGLPAGPILDAEGVMVMSEETALKQDIRPLHIGLLNLMPNKSRTETQFARLIGATPLQIDLTLLRMSEHLSRHTPAEYLEAFYQPWRDAEARKFDGLIVTGAPVELLPFAEVTYWDELQRIFDWTQTNVTSTFAVCWGAQAMLNYFHAVPKHALPRKAFGCYRHRNTMPGSPYLRGFSDNFTIPVSRWTEVRADEVPANLNILAAAEETGPSLIEDKEHRALYMFNHIEYDTTSLRDEYERERASGKNPDLPQNYFPDDDPGREPENRWRSHAHLLFSNWINELYQRTPYDPSDIGKVSA